VQKYNVFFIPPNFLRKIFHFLQKYCNFFALLLLSPYYILLLSEEKKNCYGVKRRYAALKAAEIGDKCLAIED